jgi:hypothetical protein
MPTTESQRLDDMMRKVEGLLATAESYDETNPETAANYRANAERIMTKYRIAQEDLIKRGGEVTNQFDIMFHEVKAYLLGCEFADVYRSLLSYCVHHTDCRLVWTGYTHEGDAMFRMGTIIGYEADVRYAEMLFMSARLVFAARMEPQRNPALSDEDNVYAMRMAGMERSRIGLMMGWGGEGTKGPGKVTRLFKKACDAREEDASALLGKGNNVKHFRETYTEEFTSAVWQRLYNARIAVEHEGGGIVLHGRKERVQEAVYQKWPNLRPVPVERSLGQSKERTLKQKMADERRWAREAAKRMERENSKAGRAGKRAGRAAADEVAINNATPKRRLGE